MGKPQALLKRGISSVHEAFADYMLINPGCRLREMAAYFGYTVPWISTVINSDMFKSYMAGRRGDINVSIMEDLPTRLKQAAALATERMIEVVEKSEDADTLIDAFDKILHRCGYAPNTKQGGGAVVNNQQNNVFFVNKDDLAQAREMLLANHAAPMLEEKAVNEQPMPAT